MRILNEHSSKPRGRRGIRPKKESKMYTFDSLLKLGIAHSHAVQLRRISMTLNRWFELECGDGNNYASWSIVRGKKIKGIFEYDDNGRPYLETHPHDSSKTAYTPISDRERGAMKRLNAIMANYPNLEAYVQTDPRGASLYIGTGLTDSNYSHGVAVYK
jgi:hypothetical protein